MYYLRSIKFYLIAILTCLSVTTPHITWSEDRIEYPFIIEALEDYSTENKPYQRYANQRFIQGKDVVIFGSEVTITTPLLSNGGDVIIFTDHLHVAAPIDTRVYFDHDGDFFEKDSENGCRSILTWLKGADTVIDSFELFYRLSDDVWDDRKKQYVLKPAKRFPEAPAGMTLCANPGSSSRGIEYFPIQAMKWENLRSGNITVFAHRITFCRECKKLNPNWNGVKAEIPEIVEPKSLVKDTTLFNARGLRGSRGGMPFWGCAYRGASNPKVCVNPPNHYRRGPFRGGDAGDVSIYLVNNTDTYQQEQKKPPAQREFMTRIGVTGGQQGSHVKFAASCFSLTGVGLACPKAPDHPTRKIWGAPYPEEVWPDAPKAQDGTFVMDSLNSDEALSLLSLRLHALRLNRLSKASPVSKDLMNIQKTVLPQPPIDHLTEYLLTTLQEVYLHTTSLAMNLEAKPPSSSPLPQVFDTIFQTRDQPFTFSPFNTQIYFSLAQFHFYKKNGTFNDFLRDMGGLLNFSLDSALSLRKPFDTSRDRIHIDEVTQPPSTNLKASHPSLFEFVARNHDAKFKRALQRLQTSLSRTLKTVSRQTWFSQVSESLDGSITSLLDVRRQYDKQQYHAMFQGVLQMGESLFLFDKERRPFMPSLAPSHQQFPIFDEYRLFLEWLETMAHVMVGLKNSEVDHIRENPPSYFQNRLRSLDFYPDLLRVMMLDEVRRGTAFKSPSYFRDLLLLKQFLRWYPQETLTSNNWTSSGSSCANSEIPSVQHTIQKPTGKSITCLEVTPSKNHWTELRVHPDRKTLGDMVLYRFPPSGMKKVINLGGLFYDYELQWDGKAQASPY